MEDSGLYWARLKGDLLLFIAWVRGKHAASDDITSIAPRITLDYLNGIKDPDHNIELRLLENVILQ